jgi:hypothetical protein
MEWRHRDEKQGSGLIASGLRGEVREHGKMPNTPAALKALTVKLVGKNQSAAILLRRRTVRLWHPTPAQRSWSRMCRGRSVIDQASGSKRTDAMQSTLPSCIAPVN